MPPAPPAFGRGSVAGPVDHDAPVAADASRSRIQGSIHPRGPLPGPAPQPVPMNGFPASQPLPAPDPTQQARRRGAASRNWAIVTAVLFGLGAMTTWGSYQSPGGSPVMSLLLGPLSSILCFAGVVASGVLGAYVISTLRALRDRAIAWDPPLARSQKQIGAMHLVPGRNIAGPIVVFAETGVRGNGKWAWFAACALWPIALISVIVSDSAVGVFRTAVVATLAAVVSAITAAALVRALSPPDPRRMVPGSTERGEGRVGTDFGFDLDSEADSGSEADADVDAAAAADAEPFWSRGLITPRRSATPKTLTPPIDDSITTLYLDRDAADPGPARPVGRDARTAFDKETP
ncbi:hypothetical protein [uncultured Corynebacterium sp.]|uniref:hypothetical protein n=1 Tax=uncultured Corynebacterium sp. TaxID=159447 RepID=UPI0025E6EFE8|nr:hypothetical protein [uncultured Corynebacterium sp.]